MDNKEVILLFHEYKRALAREFHDKASVVVVGEICKKIAEELLRLGYIILVQSTVAQEEALERGVPKKFLAQHFTLYLFHGSRDSTISSDTSKAVDTTTAIAKIYYYEGVSNETKELSLEDRVFFQKAGIMFDETPPPSRIVKDWTFGDDERHVLVHALRKHWDELNEAAVLQEIPVDSLEFWEDTIAHVGTVLPTERDWPLFRYFVDMEIIFLREQNSAYAFGDCECLKEEHQTVLEKWKKRNLLS